MQLFKIFVPLVSYLNFRTEQSMERRYSDEMKADFRLFTNLVALCDSTADIANVQKQADRELAQYKNARGFEPLKAELLKYISIKQGEILTAERAELDEVNDMVQLLLNSNN